MPLSISQIKEATASLDVYKVLGLRDLIGALVVTYRYIPTYSFDDKEKWAADESPEGEYRYWASCVAGHITGWNLTDGGQPIPVTEEAMIAHDVPVEALQDILEALRRKSSPPLGSGVMRLALPGLVSVDELVRSVIPPMPTILDDLLAINIGESNVSK